MLYCVVIGYKSSLCGIDLNMVQKTFPNCLKKAKAVFFSGLLNLALCGYRRKNISATLLSITLLNE